ncbi:hypothetical protein Q5752_000609 [Cryptotrichosporon argae]
MASSSSSAPRQLARLVRRPALSRTFAAPAYAAEPEPSPSYARAPSTGAHTTALSAQAYISDMFRLAPSAALPPPLALQALTHKSFRYAHRLRAEQGYAAHNARLGFVGRRALAGYLAMWLHEAAVRGGAEAVGRQRPRAEGYAYGQGEQADGLGQGEGWTAFWGSRSVEARVEALMNPTNIGREVGAAWQVADVMRWDGNDTSREGGALGVRGQTVEAVLGAVFAHLGSPAAHAAFHHHVLPHLARQLREPALVDDVARVARLVSDTYGGGIVRG